MKKFQLLLLDTGPIIKLFELGIWDKFLQTCDVTMSRVVADEAKWASQEFEDVRIDMAPYEGKGLIRIIDRDATAVGTFYSKLSPAYKDLIEPDDGEVATLEFLLASSEKWILCSADGPVFRLMGSLGRGDQNISLEELLDKIGLRQSALEWPYTKEFRQEKTRQGQIEAAQKQ
ncbi:MAG: hypothetical protein MUO27_12465 [Sedimentisphaerales bacterium]|nr:hypothetical protein [Sedimentisphaerales bacterium]